MNRSVDRLLLVLVCLLLLSGLLILYSAGQVDTARPATPYWVRQAEYLIIGIVGAVIGGFLGNMIFGIGGVSGVDIRSILISVVGALLLLWIYRMATRGRTRVP